MDESQMNAYELADFLDYKLEDVFPHQQDTIDMLRQLANEKAELEKQELNAGGEPVKNATYWKRQHDKLADRIAELENEKGLSRNSPSPMNQAYLTRYEDDYKPYGYVWTSLKDCMETRFTRSYPLEFYKPFDIVPVYTTPQTKPLSDEEIEEVIKTFQLNSLMKNLDYKDFARAIEAKVRGEK